MPDEGRVWHSEEAVGTRGRRHEPEVLVGPARGRPPARRALEQPALEQIGLVDVLDRVLLLPHARGERRQADRAALELAADAAQELAVEAIEAELVDLEH